jgi:hypothetical protein
MIRNRIGCIVEQTVSDGQKAIILRGMLSDTWLTEDDCKAIADFMATRGKRFHCTVSTCHCDASVKEPEAKEPKKP